MKIKNTSPKLSILLVFFYFAWPRLSSGSDGLYLSPLSDMSHATSDCLEPYFCGPFSFLFLIIACVLTFLGPLFLFVFFTMCTLFG